MLKHLLSWAGCLRIMFWGKVGIMFLLAGFFQIQPLYAYQVDPGESQVTTHSDDPGPLTSHKMPLCGDVNNTGNVNIIDVVYLFNYCFRNGPVPPNLADADCDGYSSITIRDIDYLNRYIFNSGAPPNCSLGGPYLPALEPLDTITFEPNELPANDSIITVILNYKNSSSINALALPLKVTIGDSIPLIDYVVLGSRMSVFNASATTVDSSLGTVNVGFVCVGCSGLSPGSDTMLSLHLSIAPVPFIRPIRVDTVQLAPSNYPLFLKPATLDGVIPVFVQQHRNDTLNFTAYSPVNLIVTAPNLDSIGINFNTIPGASYDTAGGHDRVIIPDPLLGQYEVKVVTEPGGSGTYTLSVKLDGNEERVMVANASAPPPGQIDSVVYTVSQYVRGDANGDGRKSVSDVVFLINYLFKGGTAPDPLYLGDVNCQQGVNVADVIYLVNYLFKGGPPPCS